MIKIRGFSPYVLVLFLNAFTDLGHKITIHNTLIKAYSGAELVIYSALINAMILLPFILLFTPAGFLSDKFPKNVIMRYSAWFAVAITLLITASYYLGLFWISFGLTFLLALQSALYSPAKYGYIKELVGVTKLARGNAWVQGTTIVAILLGTVAYTVVFEGSLPTQHMSDKSEILRSVTLVGWLLVAGSIIELILSYRIPKMREADPSLKFDRKKYLRSGYLKENIALLRKKPIIWFSILSLSLVFAVSQVVLATFPAFAKDVFNEDNTIFVQGTMLLASIGIIIGAFLAAKFSKNYIETGVVPLSGIGITIVIFAIPLIGSLPLQSLNFFFFGLFFGLILVPLNAIIQYHANEHDLGTILAGNNFIQNIFMVSFLFATMALTLLEVSVVTVFEIIGYVALFMALFGMKNLPDSMIRFVAYFLLKKRYRQHITGTENIPNEGGVLLLGNHISWLDWALLSMATIRPIHFVMERVIYEKWYFKWFLDYFEVIPVSMRAGKKTLEIVQKRLNDGDVICIFPEGSISRTGNLGVFQRGFEYFAKDTNAVIIPFYMHGLWGSFFSRSSERLRRLYKVRTKRDLIVAFGTTMDINSNRHEVKQAVFKLSFSAWKAYSNSFKPLHIEWLKTAKKLKSELAIADTLGTQLSYTKLLTAVILFSRVIKRKSPEKHIGLMLPTTAGGAIGNFAVFTLGKVACNLNYTAGETAIRVAIKKADIKTVYTARAFTSKLNERGLDVEKLSDLVTLEYLEDIKATFSKKQGLLTLLQARFLPRLLLSMLYFKNVSIDDTAEILFSSGSEGEPKGVELTHRNIMNNIRQVTDTLNEEDDDVMMNILPLFHAMGLNPMLLKPLIDGTLVICHPDPRDAETIGKAVAKYQVTIMVATSTFYRIYNKSKKLLPLMFDSLRIVVAGAEKLSPDVYRDFKAKFGKDIYEGYGVTEVCPVSGFNMPDKLDTTFWTVQESHKVGTVGLPLPGTAYKVVDPDSLEELPIGEDGLILIGGVQIMKGYLNDEARTKEAIIEREGLQWYKSGDKGHLDVDGFLTVVDRYSRFAKLGGEMVGLTALEDKIKKIINSDEIEIITTHLADAKKGEKIILLVAGDIDLIALNKEIRSSDINPLAIPSETFLIEAIPILGSGKRDFAGTKKLAQELLNERS